MSDQQQSQDSEKNQLTPPEVERTKARKVVQGFTQSLVQWMPLGGSGGLLVAFIHQQEWLQAVLMFPVMVVTVVWAAYTESFLTRLREVYQERGKKDVDYLMALQEKLDLDLRRQFAGTKDKKYLRCQGNACRQYRTEGYDRGTFDPLLSEVFVPLELSGNKDLPMPPGFRLDDDSQLLQPIAGNELKIWDLLARVKRFPVYRRMAILALGGYGKTTLLKHITYTYAERCHRRYKVPEFLPVLLPLRQWQEAIYTEPDLDLASLIEKHHIPSLPEGTELKLPPYWAKNKLKSGKMLVMFDGFDEVKPEWRKWVCTWLDKQMMNYQESVFILTSRPGGYKDYKVANPPSSKLYVKPFNDNQQERFIGHWYLTQERYVSAGRNTPEVKESANSHATNLFQQIKQHEELKNLAKYPLLLNMIVNLHRSYEGQPLPQHRSELYQEIFTLQLKDRPPVRLIEMLVPFPGSQQVLQKVALDLTMRNQSNLEWQELNDLIYNSLQSLDLSEIVKPSDFLNQIVEVSELIVKRNEYYEFAHLSFQSYLAATEIKDRKQEPLLLEHWQDSWWKETILLYCAQVNPSNLIRSFLEIKNSEAIKLASECLKASRRKVDPKLEAELQKLETSVNNLVYQQLEEYLKNEQWKEADRETYRLMIQAVGKEEGQCLDPQDLENFPCQDLRTINQLWLKYSNGKFGFSVQNEIYQSLEGTKDYDYNDEVWEKFGDHVGWRGKGGEWMYYTNLTFDREAAPEGHLPVARGIIRGGMWWSRVVLFSRAKTCNL